MLYFPYKRLLAHLLLLGQLISSCSTPNALRMNQERPSSTQQLQPSCLPVSARSASNSSIQHPYGRPFGIAKKPLYKPLFARPFGPLGTFPALSNSPFHPFLFGPNGSLTPPLTTYTLFKHPGYRIELERSGDRWQAMVHDHCFPGFSRSYAAEVVFEQGLRLEDFIAQDRSYQSRHIHLFSKDRDRPVVYIGFMGLKGGGCCGRATWSCGWCGFVCPSSCCEPHCGHKSEHERCRIKQQRQRDLQQLQQEHQNRSNFLYQQNLIDELRRKEALLQADLARQESSSKSTLLERRAERSSQAYALYQELKSQKQAIKQQTILDETTSQYHQFVSNLAVEVELTESQAQETTTSQAQQEDCHQLEVPADNPAAEASPVSVEETVPTIHPKLPLGSAFPPPASVGHYKQLSTFSSSSDSGLSIDGFQEDSDQEADDSGFESGGSRRSSCMLEDVSQVDFAIHPSPLRRAASLDNLSSAFSLKVALLSAPAPITRLFTYYSLHLTPSQYLAFLKETGNLMQEKLQQAPLSVQQAFIDYLIKDGRLYPAIVKNYCSSEWLVRSLVQTLIQDPSSKANPITLEQFDTHWTTLSQRYPMEQQIDLLNALWEAQKNADLTLLQLTHILELVAATGKSGYDMVCMEQPDKLVHLKQYWLLDQVNSLPQFVSSASACRQLADGLAHTQLSPAFIPTFLSTIRKENDLPALLSFLSVIAKRSVPEFIIQSILSEKETLLASDASKPQQWVTSLLCQLSFMHLAQIDPKASEAIAPILYKQISQVPAMAPAAEEFIYTHCQTIASTPATFVELLELLHNYRIKEDITTAVFEQLAEEAPAQWITKADQVITAKLFQASHTYSVEELMQQIVQAAPVGLSLSSDHAEQAAHYLKKATIDKVLKQQVVENLKPAIKKQLNEVTNTYRKKLDVLIDNEMALRDTITKVEKERSDLAKGFDVKTEAYNKASTKLEKQEKELKTEIDKLEKENEEQLKKSEQEVKKLEEKVGQKAQDSPAKPSPAQDAQPKEPTKIEILRDKLAASYKEHANLRTAYRTEQDAYEASADKLSKQIQRLEVDLVRLEARQKPIESKIARLLKEDATNFSDYTLYQEVLNGFCRPPNTPFDSWNESALTAWSKQIKSKKSSNLFDNHNINEIICGINQAATFTNNTCLTRSQQLDLLTTLFPFCKKQSKSISPKDPLVVISLATICAFQEGQVSLVTDSKEWPISESAIESYLPFFRLLDLTATKRDITDPSPNRNSHIVYGKSSDFSAIPDLISYDALKQKQQSIDSCYHAPSSLLQSAVAEIPWSFKEQPIATWSKEEISQWANYVQRHLPNPDCISQGTLDTEAIAVTQHAAELIQEAPLTRNQRYGLLTLLYPSLDKGQLLQEAKKDHLVTAMFAAIRSLQAKQSHILPSKSLGTLTPQQPLFDLLNLTLAAQKDPVPPDLLSFLPNFPQAPTKDQEGTLEQSEGSMQAKQDKNQSTATKAAAGHSDLTDIADAAGISTPAAGGTSTAAGGTATTAAGGTATSAAGISTPAAGGTSTTAAGGTATSAAGGTSTSAATETSTATTYEQLKKQYDALIQSYTSPSQVLQNSSLSFKQQPISQWKEEAVTAWATYMQSNYKPGLGLEIELIAGVKRAVELTHKLTPRATQLLSLLMLLPSGSNGRLAQINTGEGKSLIVAMLAAIHGLQGRQVDVITTSTELSIPEVKKQTPFFKVLNLTIAENSKSSNKVTAYKSQIVYGTSSDFQSDILKKEFLGEDNRGERGHDIVLVDEVDSLLFDNRTHSVRLTSSNPGMDDLRLPLGAIWQHIQWLTDHMCACNGKVYFTPEDVIDANTQVLKIADKRAFITEQTKQHLTSLLRKLDATEAQEYKTYFEKQGAIAKVEQEIKELDHKSSKKEKTAYRDQLEKELQALPWNKRNPILDVPQHLRQFAQMQIPIWINNCLNALYVYKRNAHYAVQKDRIVPIQHNETGVLQHDLVWSDGLSQFLQMKEGLAVDAESISTNFLSNIGFFKRYGQSIYGLTGTLGEPATRSFLEELYGVDFVIVPPYQRRAIQDNSHTPYLCKELAPIVVDKKDWYPAILHHLLHHAKQGRAVLPICKYMSEADYLAKQLKAHYDPTKVFTYTGVDPFEKEHIDSGEIILATNIAGRGTDLKTTEQVEAHGGMYVAVTFLPESYRVELQNVGRTARSGKKGMAQLILWHPDGSKADIETIKKERQEKEARTTQRALEDAKKMLVQDALFQHFCGVENEYLPSAADCVNLDRSETILFEWNQVVNREFTDEKIEAKFQDWSSKQKAAWDNRFAKNQSDQSHNSQVDQAIYAKKEQFKAAYKAKLLERFQETHPNLSDSLLTCLKSGAPFCPAIPELAKKNEWGTFERKAVEERWGIWLKTQQLQEQSYNAANTLPLFEQFDTQLANQFAQDAPADKLIANPYFYVLKGNKLLTNGQPSKAISCYDRALTLDSTFSLHAHYNKARALLSFKENKGTKQEQAYAALETAHTRILTLSRPNLMAFHSLLGHGAARTHTVTAIQRDLHLVSQQEQYIRNALKILDETSSTGDKKPYDVKLTYQSLKATFKDPKAAEAHAKNIRDMALKGLTDLFTIEKVIPYPLASIISMALISLSQIAIGCVLSVYGGPQLGMALIRSGISDMVTTIKAAIKGSFDWGAWAVQKGIEIVVSVASAGVTMAKEAMKNVKEGVQGLGETAASIKDGLQNTTQAVKNIFGTGAATSDITITTAAKEAITKTPIQAVKDTLVTQLKQTATGEMMEQAAQWCADELLINRESERIRQAVRSDLTEAFTKNQLIAKALALDRQQENTYWQQCFLQEAGQILDDKLNTSSFRQRLLQIGKGVMYNTVHYSKKNDLGENEIVVGAQEGVLAAKGIRGLYRSIIGDIAPFTKEFIEEFEGRIATYEQAIEESQQAEQQTQQATVHSTQQATTMSDAPPLDLDEAEIVVNNVDNISSFRAPDRNANQIKLEEHFSNLGLSTPENLVHQIETRICEATIQELNDAVKPIGSYGVSWVNNKLYEKANKENQAFLNTLSARGLQRYAEDEQEKQDKKRKKQEKKQRQRPKRAEEKKQEEASSNKQKGNKQSETQKANNKETAFAEQQRKVFEEGEPLTLGHMAVASYHLEMPVHVFDEKGQLLKVIGSYKPGEPIALSMILNQNGDLAHIKPLHLTDDQSKQYDSLDHTQNDCMLNALFVHLPKEKQDEFRDVQGYRKDCRGRSKLYGNSLLLLREEQLRQLAPAEVPQVGAFPVAAIAVGAVRVGMAACSAYQLYAAGRDIINDPLVQKSWEEGHYRDAFGYSMPHVPGVGDAIHAKHAWYLRDYKGALLHGGSAGITFFGTFSGIKDGVKGGKWIVKKGLPKFRNLRVEKWWSKQGAVRNSVEESVKFANRVKEVQSKISKNSIKLPSGNPNIRYRYDLRGAPHKGVPTPHVQREIRNVDPKGKVHWNKDRKWVEPMKEKDLKKIEEHLNSIKK